MHLTYLEGGELMEVDSTTGRAHVLVSAVKMAPLDENNVSERDRANRVRYNMRNYFWAPDSVHLLFDSDGRLWLYDLHNGTGLQIGFTGLASGDDPKFSPDGCSVSFIRDNGLAVIRLRDPGTPMSFVAPSPNRGLSNGEVFLNGRVDWVYEEELDVRSNYFWSRIRETWLTCRWTKPRCRATRSPTGFPTTRWWNGSATRNRGTPILRSTSGW